MAALQKVRNWSKLIIAFVGIALFAFIAEELVRVISYRETESRQRIGSIYGDNISLQEFNDLVDEYQQVLKVTNPAMANLSDEQMHQVREQVWNTYVQNQVIAHEAEKLGLQVTDKELQQVVQSGNHQRLAQTIFVNDKGQFDYAQLKQFLSQYSEIMNNADIPTEQKEQFATIYKYWKFIEKNIRLDLLSEKYSTLLASSMISNQIIAKKNFEARTTSSDVVLAAVPYTSIKDSDIKVSDDELKAKYDELKELFVNPQELREIKYISVGVKASKEDIKALEGEMDGYAAQLAEGVSPAIVVRDSKSTVPYSALPVSKRALPTDVAAELDSISEGTQKGPYYYAADNTLNIVRLISKVSRPDSVEIQQIVVPGNDRAAAEKSADSILTALNGGAVIDSIAVKYGNTSPKIWVTSAEYEGRQMDDNIKNLYQTITTAAVGSVHKIAQEGQPIRIVRICDNRNFETKYDVAVIKTPRSFSKDTYNKAFNDFSSFLAGKNAADIEAGALKAGYMVEKEIVASTTYKVADVGSTREALRWIFKDDTKVGDVSPLYECGNNDNLLCVILTNITKKGYYPWDDERVKQYLTDAVMRDKKAEKIMEKMNGVKDLASAGKIAGAVSDTLRNVTFAQTAYVNKFSAPEPALTGSITARKQGEFRSGVKGNAAVYAYQVLAVNKQKDAKFNKKDEEAQLEQMATYNIFQSGILIQDLLRKANVKDNRYLFY